MYAFTALFIVVSCAWGSFALVHFVIIPAILGE